MTRVYAVVEGATEEGFLRDIVVPHLAGRSVSCNRCRSCGEAEIVAAARAGRIGTAT
jgi:hypothetical protein